MIIAVGILVVIAIGALSIVGLGESHSRVSRILSELDYNRVKQTESETPTPMPVMETQTQKVDVFAEVGFTRSLLALSKVPSQDLCEVPIPERAESSSLVSVRHVQSKNRAQAL